MVKFLRQAASNEAMSPIASSKNRYGPDCVIAVNAPVSVPDGLVLTADVVVVVAGATIVVVVEVALGGTAAVVVVGIGQSLGQTS